MTRDEQTSFGLAIGLAVTLILVLGVLAKAQAPAPVDRAKFAATWNDIEAAVDRLNVTRHEIGDSIELFPPWRVASFPKQQRRRELYDAAAHDAELMAKRYRQLRDLEQ
jgi:hypothetical protein